MSEQTSNIHSKPTRQVGFVLKPHGYSGQLRIETDEDFYPDEFLLIAIHGRFVPFRIESEDTGNGIIKLEGINSKEAASVFTGLPILELIEKKVEETPDLIGYTLIDSRTSAQYEITGIVEYPGNILLEFRSKYKDCLLPYHPDLITKIDHRNQTVEAVFPEGLTDV